MSALSDIVERFRAKNKNIAAAFDEVERRLVKLEGVTPPPPPPPGPGPTVPGNVALPGAFLVFDPATQRIPPASPWNTEGELTGFKIVDDDKLGKALSLKVGPGSTGPNDDSYLASVFVGNGAPARATEGQRTKYRVVVRVPADFKTASGEWEFVAEWHVPFTGPYSTCLGIFTDGNADLPIVGTSPRWWMEVRGGTMASPTRKRVTLPASEFKPGEVYVHDFEFFWSVDPAKGLAVWTVNGVEKLRVNQPTLYRDGPQNAFGVYNYRKLAPFDTELLFGVFSAAAA